MSLVAVEPDVYLDFAALAAPAQESAHVSSSHLAARLTLEKCV
jgi:hypothetical protein